VNNKGYTLIELVIVVVLVCLMVFLSVPRVREVILQDNLQSAVRRITGIANERRVEAIRGLADNILVFDITNGKYWTYSQDMTPEKRDAQKKDAVELPTGVQIEDIQQPGQDRKVEGEVTILFSRLGYVQPTVIHLIEGDRHYTLVLQPFLSMIEVYERYQDFNETTLAGA
jgi:prepilin-type N-terminal cleavage/methylation domain-containing protein